MLTKFAFHNTALLICIIIYPRYRILNEKLQNLKYCQYSMYHRVRLCILFSKRKCISYNHPACTYVHILKVSTTKWGKINGDTKNKYDQTWILYVTRWAKNRHFRTFLKFLFIAFVFCIVNKKCTAKVSASCDTWTWSYSARNLEQ